MKKKAKKLVALFMTFIMIASVVFMDLPSRIFADGDVAQDTLNWSVTINGINIDDVTQIKNGDKVEIKVDWRLANGPKEENPYEQILELNPMENVHVPEWEAPLTFNGNPVGIIEVKDNKIRLSLTDEAFLKSMNTRYAGGTIEGELSLDEGNIKNGDKIKIDLGDVGNWEIEYNDGSQAYDIDSSKTAGKSTYDKENGVWTQEYTVSIGINDWKKDKDGNPIEMTINSVTDIPGSGLSNPSGLTVFSNNVAALDKKKGDALSYADLNGLVIKSGEFIEYTYTMQYQNEALGAAYAQGGAMANTVNNELDISYKDNFQHDKKQPNNASINANRIVVGKTLGAGATDEEQVWTVAIQLNGVADVGETLKDVVKSIKDEGKGLVFEKELTIDDFKETAPGSGKYVATYKTTLADEYKNLESYVINNKVEVSTKKYGDYEANATYTTQGNDGASITKTFDSYDPTSGKLTWKVTLHNISTEYKEVILKDETTREWGNDLINGKTAGKHTICGDIKVNDTVVISDGTIKDSTIVNRIDGAWDGSNGNGLQFVFTDDFINDNNGKDITVTYTTQIADTTEAGLKNKRFLNDATLSYDPPVGNKKEKTASAYHDVEVENAITKDAVVGSDKLSIDYTVDIDLDDLGIVSADGSNLTITDNLPAGLVLDADSIKAVDLINGGDLKNDTGTHYYPKGKSGLADNHYWQYWINDDEVRNNSKFVSDYALTDKLNKNVSGNTITFTIPIGEGYDIIQKYRELYSPYGNYVIRIQYTAKIDDPDQFAKDGEDKTFTNEATYSYKDHVPGEPAKVTTTLEAPKIVKKKGEFVKEYEFKQGAKANAVHYSVDINPNGYDLSTGRLEAVDTLGPALSYDLKSVKCYEVDADGNKKELETGTGANQFSFQYDYAANTLTFSLPDEKHLMIEYYAMTNVYNGANGEHAYEFGDLTAENAYNKFSLSGEGDNEYEDSYSVSQNTMQTSNYAGAATGAIDIRKYWTDGGKMLAVVGSQFKVYECNDDLSINKEFYNGALYAPETPDGGSYKEHLYTIQDKDGVLHIDELRFNTIYKLVEVNKGGGYDENNDGDYENIMAVSDDEGYYFVIPGSKDDTRFADEFKTIASGNFIDFENQEDEKLEAEYELAVQKLLNDDNVLGDYLFQFAIEELEAPSATYKHDENPKGTSVSTVGFNDGNGTVSFKNITDNKFTYSMGKTWTAKDTHYYKIYEINNGAYEKVTYDENYYIVQVDVSVNADKSGLDVVPTITKYTKNENGTYTASAAGDDGIVFNNTYEEEHSAEIELVAKKTVAGVIQTGAFTFRLQEVDEKGISIGEPEDKKNGDNSVNDNRQATFKKTYTAEDVGNTYYYKLSEVNNKDDYDYIYDTDYFLIEVEVLRNATNEIITKATVTKHDAAGKMLSYAGGTEDMRFENTQPSVKASFRVKKSIQGLDSIPAKYNGAFQFKLTDISVGFDLKAPQVLVNNGSNVTFTDITFNPTDVGTHQFKIEETGFAKTVEGISKDSTVYYVQFDVVQDPDDHTLSIRNYTVRKDDPVNGELVDALAPVTIPQIEFVNTLAGKTEVTLTANKTFDGGMTDLSEKDPFTFRLVEQSLSAGVYTDKASGKRLTVTDDDKDGEVTFEKITYDADSIGRSFYYKISEAPDVPPQPYVDYDSSYYIVKVDVTQVADDVGINASVADVYKYVLDESGNYVRADGKFEEPDIIFDNKTVTYTSAKIDIEAKKELKNGALTAGMFDFVLESTNANGTVTGVVQTKKNAADGSVAFDTITFEETMVDDSPYYYKVSEVKAGTDYIFDESYYLIQVTLTRGTGVVNSDVNVTKYVKDGSTYKKDTAFTGGEADLTFVNNKPSVKTTFSAEKSIKGINMNTAKFKNAFRFTLEEVMGAGLPITEPVTLTANNAAGSVSFGDITYGANDVGTHTYKITEDAGVTVAGIRNDNTVYFVKVTVARRADNSLYISQYECRKNTPDGALTDKIKFENTISTAANITLSANKTIDGETDGLASRDPFTFTLVEQSLANGTYSNVTGGISNSKTDTDKDGTVEFDPIVYDADSAGHSYYYKISEDLSNRQENIAYDQSYYIVKVDVTRPENDVTLSAEISRIDKYEYKNGKYVAVTGTFTTDDISFNNQVKAVGYHDFVINKTLMEKNGDQTNAVATPANEFSFDVIEVTADVANPTAVADGVSATVQNKADGTAAYTAAYEEEDASASGTKHYYQIKEKTVGVSNKYIYDKSFYIVTVDVKLNVADTGRSITVTETNVTKYVNNNGTYVKDNSYASTAVGFTNEVSVAELQLEAGKKLAFDNIDNYDGQFRFKVESVGNTPYYNATAVNDGEEVIFEPKLKFYADDIGLGKQHIYRITEQVGTSADFVYDTTVYYADVTLTMDPATNAITPTVVYRKGSAASTELVATPVFNNKKKMSVKVPVSGTKYLNEQNINIGVFTFGLYDKAGNEIARSTNGIDGLFGFELTYDEADYEAQKKYEYVVKEIIPPEGERLPGYEYDESEFSVEIELKNNNDGKITPETAIYRIKDKKGKQTAKTKVDEIRIDNIFDTVYSWPLKATKILRNSNVADEAFAFEILEATENGLDTSPNATNKVYSVVTNNAYGDLEFYGEDFMYNGDNTKRDYYYVMREISAPGEIPIPGGDLVLDVINDPMIDYSKVEYLIWVHLNFIEGGTVLETEIKMKAGMGGNWSRDWEEYLPSKAVFTNNVTVEINKADASDDTALSGAELAVFDDDTMVGESWITDGNGHDISGIALGKVYTLRELNAPSGYLKADDINFKVEYIDGSYVLEIADDNGEFHPVDGTSIVMKDSRKKLVISKEDTGGKSVPDAVLMIYQKDDQTKTAIINWNTAETDANPYEIDVVEAGLEENVVYVLRETLAPYGYITAEEIEFMITEDGKVVSRPYDSQGAFGEAEDILVMVDELATMSIQKTDISNGKEIAGAKLIISEDAAGKNTIAEWVSQTDNEETADVDESKHEINIAEFEQDKVYYLTEITAPYGYEIAETIEFRIDRDNNVYARPYNEAEPDAEFMLVTDNLVIMEDARKQIGISKQEIAGTTSKYIDDAVLEITKKSDGTPVVEAWATSSADNEEENKSKVKQIDILTFTKGEVYVLTETSAPFGYEIAESIEFKIDSNKDGTDNNVIYVKDKTGKFVSLDADEIVMLDEHMKLQIGKTDMGGKLIDGARLKITEKDNDDTVIAEWTSSKKAAQKIDVLDSGIRQDVVYVLTEITAPFGYEMAESIEFKVVVNAENKTEVLVKDKATGEFVRQGADKNTLTMEDAYKTFTIRKVDEGNKQLKKAELSIRDNKNKKLVSWTTDGTDKVINLDPALFKPTIQYTLVEDKAPSGYDVAATIKFMFDNDGNVYVKSGSEFEAVADKVIIMVDEKATTTEATTEKTTTEKTTTEKTTTEKTTVDVTEETTSNIVASEDTESTITAGRTEDDTTEPEKTTTEKENTNNNVSTGDSTPLKAVLIIMFMSFAGAICVFVKKREEEE